MKSIKHFVIFLIFFLIINCTSLIAAEVKKVAIVKSADLTVYNAPVKKFKKYIQETLGFTFKEYNIKGNEKTGKKILKIIKKEKYDLIFTLGIKATLLARKRIKKIPIVFAMVLNSEQYDLKNNNITGISLEIPSNVLFSQFTMIAPNIKKIGVLYHPDSSGAAIEKAIIELRKLGINLTAEKVFSEDNLPESFNKIASQVDGFWMTADPFIINKKNFKFLLKKTLALKIPFIAYSEPFVNAGALFSLSPDYFTIGSQAGAIVKNILVDKISPGKIQVAPPIGTFLVINKKTALDIGIEFDDFILQIADKIVGN